ncbi:hypothetical protein J5837_07310 [Pseudoxanthomonas helianthi]|uniref:Lipoprotein n=1 Tax=Pseudoxanthomonas helianthi TaxID=1453541 RepID=A0A940X1J0_9GAMM|nr:hypothetical protein [Pseudoxanthomonas helianthi]MBP3984233.1 hypothetical protein [Pseudoxanthomonas helianthi]
MKFRFAIIAAAIALAACTDREAAQREAAAALAQQQEEAAADLAEKYDQELVAQRWEKARIHGAALLAQYPNTKAAAQVKQTFDDTKAKAETQREQDRLSSLWNYAEVPAAGGTQRSASIYSKEGVDVDSSGPRTVQLVFRDHPKWKRSSYLVLQAGDFRCAGGCTVKVSADGGAPKSMAATRPNTDEAIAMFIEDNKGLWRLAGKSKKIEIEFPVKAGGTRKAVFETGGVNKERMPGWN